MYEEITVPSFNRCRYVVIDLDNAFRWFEKKEDAEKYVGKSTKFKIVPVPKKIIEKKIKKY